jgi:hypothetical protein
MDISATTFFAYWDRVMRFGAYTAAIISIALIIFYEWRASSLKDNKEKYDYINQHEIKYFWFAIIMLLVAISMFINSVGTTFLTQKSHLWFIVRLFLTVSFAIISYFISFGMVRIYYPGNIERRLRKLRDKTRISPSGNPMRKLSEEEEDAHLEAVQIEDEAIRSIDYDVWIDEKTGYKKIEKYYNYQHAELCPECGYYTLKIEREEVEKAPTEKERGTLLQHYECSYCNHREIHSVRIAKVAANQIVQPST